VQSFDLVFTHLYMNHIYKYREKEDICTYTNNYNNNIHIYNKKKRRRKKDEEIILVIFKVCVCVWFFFVGTIKNFNLIKN